MKRTILACCATGVVMALTGCGFQIGTEKPLNEVLGTTETATVIENTVMAETTTGGPTEETNTPTERTSEKYSEDTSNATGIEKKYQEELNKLETDYSKIYWGSSYSIFENYPGVVVSVAPYVDYDKTGLVVGITNLYDVPIQIYGNLSALSADGGISGTAYLYKPCIGAGDTAMEYIHCDTAPDGRILWEDAAISDSIYQSVNWTSNYKLSGNPADGQIDIAYSVQTTGKITDSCILLLDEKGNILAATYDYPENNAGSLTIYGNADVLGMASDIAMFINPVTEN